MIKRECDKWFLKNRHERFGQIVGQRSQARSEAGTENERLRDEMT